MLYPVLLIVGDFVALLAAFTIAYLLRADVDSRPLIEYVSARSFMTAFSLMIPIWIMVQGFLGLYSKSIYERRLAEFSRLIVATFIGILMIISFDYITSDIVFPARLIVVYGFFLALALLTIERNVLWLARRYAFRFGYGLRNVAIIGNTEATKELADMLSDIRLSGYNIRLIVGGPSTVPKDFSGKVVQSLERGLELIKELKVNSIIQTDFFEKEEKNHKILVAARENHLSYRFIPAQSEFYGSKNTVEVFNGFPMVAIHQTPLIGWGRVAKRLFDVFATLLIMLIALPIMFVCGLLIKISDPKGPVVYKHRRITRFGTEFDIFKFRSMYWRYSTGPDRPYKTAEAAFKAMGRDELVKEFQEFQKVDNDPRISRIGRFMRATSVDELPQLFNVLKGDLSLVGPRAIIKDELKRYKKYNGGGLVTSVKSGITGLWQVSGRSNISYQERVELDTYYVQNWSFWLDIKILVKTIKVVVVKAGAK